MTPRPTPAQLAALRHAAVRPLAYYRGGWYGCEPLPGYGQMRAPAGVAPLFPGTLAACVSRGWLEREPLHTWQTDIYSDRWTITDAGRAILAEEEARK